MTGRGAAETLEDAWRISLGRDLLLEAAGNRVAAAEAALDSARGARWPELSAAANAIGFDHTPAFDFGAAGLPVTLPLFDGSSTLLGDARVRIPLYTSGGTRHAIGAAEARLTAERHSAGSLLQDVKLAVAEHYIGVLRAASAAKVAGDAVASLRAHLADVEDMYRGGSVPRNDLLAATVSLADAEQRRLMAGNALDVARAAYNRALGRRLDQPVELGPELPGVSREIEGRTLEELTTLAVASREELKRLAAAAEALDAGADSTAASARPQLALTGSYTFLENDFLEREDYWTVGVGISWNLFDGGRTRNRANALMRQSAAVRNEQRDFETLIALDVRRAWLERGATLQRITVTERAILQSEENLRVVRDRYRNGEGTNTEVLDAEALRSVSRGNFDSARFDATLARYRLARAVGSL
jgi:outer membrane protein TolC